MKNAFAMLPGDRPGWLRHAPLAGAEAQPVGQGDTEFRNRLW
jgi:hypothetical protein